jgi:putative hydrolase of the HAD superfamily
MNRLVVFDLDDTLFLERDYVRSGYRAVGEFVRRELGVRGFFKAAWGRFAAGERLLIFDRVLAEKGAPAGPRLIRRILEVYRTHVPRVRLCPDARRFLSRPPEGVATGVITDGRLPAQRAKVRALGVDRLVREIVITGRWGPRFAKPHPRAFLWMERKFGLRGSACAYVADNPAKDFQAPLSMGWKVLRLRRPEGLYRAAPAPPGVAEIDSCDDLMPSLRPTLAAATGTSGARG